MGTVAGLQRLVAAEASARPLAILRMVVGANVILCGVEEWSNWRGLVRPGGLRVPFVSWLEPVPADWLTPFMLVWFGAGALLAIGLLTWPVGLLLVGQLGYTLLVDQQTYSNHLYLLTLEVLYLVLGDAGACWSLDARWRGAGGAGGAADARVPAWPMTLWKWQISIVYFFAALTKINPTFLSGEMLANYWPTDGPLGFMAPLRIPAVLSPLAIGAVGAEFFLAFALWLRPLRRLALLVGIGLHAGMILLVAQKDPTGIIVFALASLPPYLLFFTGDEGVRDPMKNDES